MLDRTGVWSADRVELLKVQWAGGNSATQIAAYLGCVSRSAVLGKVNRLGLPGRKVLQRQPVKHALTREEKAERQMVNSLMRAAARREKLADGRLPPLVIKETPQPTEFLGITFMELKKNSCRFPRGEDAAITFCGQRAVKNRSYCAHCMRIAYSPAPIRRADAPPARYAAGPGAGLRAFRA